MITLVESIFKAVVERRGLVVVMLSIKELNDTEKKGDRHKKNWNSWLLKRILITAEEYN